MIYNPNNTPSLASGSLALGILGTAMMRYGNTAQKMEESWRKFIEALPNKTEAEKLLDGVMCNRIGDDLEYIVQKTELAEREDE